MNSSTSGWSTSSTTILAARLVFGGEVAAVAPPRADRRDDAPDHLLDARLALGRAQPAAEVLLRDDVGRRLRPELRELDPALLEGGRVLAGDEGVAELPLDLVERVASGDGEVAAYAERRGLVDDRVGDLLGRRFTSLDLLRAGHSAPSEGYFGDRASRLRGTQEGRGAAGRRLAAFGEARWCRPV